MAYQRKTLVPLADVGPPGDLPPDLVGLADASLADIEAAVGTPAATELGYLNTGFFPVPAPPSVQTVTNAQLRVALADAGLLDDAQLAVDASVNPHDAIHWDFNSIFQPTTPVILMIATALGATEAQVDAVFLAAAAASPE